MAIRAEAFASPDAEVLPRADGVLEIARGHGRPDLVAGTRVARFATADVWVVSPGFTLWLTERIGLSGRHYLSLTSFADRTDTIANHSGRLALRLHIRPRWWIESGYARGNESFETLSVDRIGRFRADTVSAAIRIDTAAVQSIILATDYQTTNRTHLVRVSLAFVERF